MKVNIEYGKIGYILELSDDYNIDVIEPYKNEGLNDQSKAITDGLRNPYNSEALKNILKSDDKVAIIFSDITRATPYEIILPALLNELNNIPRENICFFCATGTHRLATKKELITILGENLVNNYKIIQNDANNSDLHETAYPQQAS